MQDADRSNSQVKNLAQTYQATCESAEKFIHNYQSLKLDTMVPYGTRKASHEAMLQTIKESSIREDQYRAFLGNANQNLKDLEKYLVEHQAALKKFEEERAE